MVTFHMCRESLRACPPTKLNLTEKCELVRISVCRFFGGGVAFEVLSKPKYHKMCEC